MDGKDGKDLGILGEECKENKYVGVGGGGVGGEDA